MNRKIGLNNSSPFAQALAQPILIIIAHTGISRADDTPKLCYENKWWFKVQANAVFSQF